jgi:hypothetical protein
MTLGVIRNAILFSTARLAVASGDAGCLSLFGRKLEQHRMFSEQITAEYRVATQGRGRTVEEWKMRPEQSENHWLDCLVGCAVAASIQGAVLFGTSPAPVRKERKHRRRTLAELRQQKRGY